MSQKQDVYKLTTRVIVEGDEVKTEVIWKFHNIGELYTGYRGKEVVTVLLEPHENCECAEFCHPKNYRLKLKKCSEDELELFLVCVPPLPLQIVLDFSPTTHGYNTSIRFDHDASGWQNLRRLKKKKQGDDSYLRITLILTIDRKKIVDTMRQLENSKTAAISKQCDDMEKLLKEGTNSDVSLLSVEGIPFKVHRLILANRSEVFEAMFKHDKNMEITTSYEENVLSEILTYIYTGRVTMTRDIVWKLIGAADYYQLTGLKTSCEVILHEQLTPDNAIETLELAEKYSCEKLLEQALQYIKNGQTDLVIKTEGWKNIQSVYLLKRLFENIHEISDPVPCTEEE